MTELKKDGRGGEIRTPDLLVPNQPRYQTALRPVFQNLIEPVIWESLCIGKREFMGDVGRNGNPFFKSN